MNFLESDYISEDTIDKKAIRDGFGEGIVQAASKDENIIVLNADLPGSLRLSDFMEMFPDRYLQVGVAEQNMAGIATGLSSYGKTPVITSFAAFNPGLNFSQIRLACLGHQNLKVVGSHYGLNAGQDGASAQMNADIGMMKSLANMTILNPADFNQAVHATNKMFEIDGPVYLRVTREKFPVFLNPEAEFEIGKAQTLQEGNDITLISTGSMVYETLKTANYLSEKGVNSEVINVHTIKPIDSETIIKSAAKTKKVFIIEEHNIWGGLGESVSRVISENQPVYVKCLGVNDTFGESGTPSELWRKYGLDYQSLGDKILESIN